MKFTKEQEIEIEKLCDSWYEKAEKLAEEHYDESKLDGWDGDEPFGRYAALIDCRADLIGLINNGNE